MEDKRFEQGRSQIDNWRQMFIYSCFSQLISFEIDCFYGLWTLIYEYDPPIIYLAKGLVLTLSLIC